LRNARGFISLWALALCSTACAYSPLDPSFDTAFQRSASAATALADASFSPPAADSAPAANAPDTSLETSPPGPSLDSGAPIDAGSVSPPAQCSLSLPTGMPACDTCLGQGCCEEDNACGNDAQCMSVVECMSGCEPGEGGDAAVDASADSTACLDACAQRFPAGASVLNALDGCLASTCATPCE